MLKSRKLKEERKLWFKSKVYGLGWYSSSWQGWAILLIWILLFINIFRNIDKNSHSVSDTLIGMFIPAILLVVLLFFICYGTGERPRWRWGK